MAEAGPQRIWVTRTQPQADETAGRLRQLGHVPVTAPVLECRAVEGATVDLSDAGALAFTSRNAVAAFAKMSSRRDLPVFAVGDATAAAAREAGFAAVESAAGDLTALNDLIARRAPGLVVHPGPVEAAGELSGARSTPIYETVETDRPAPLNIDAVLIHSPKAARAVVKALLEARAEGLRAYAISQAAALPLTALKFRSVAVAPYPNEDALLKLIDD